MNPQKLPDEYSFLVDVNLPKKFSFFNSSDFIHVVDIDPCLSDEEIWDYAFKNDKVIITKDADFYEKCISSEGKPKVILMKVGNMTINELHHFFELNWGIIIKHLQEASLILVNLDNIKVII